ncbi:hypothetical protein T492DRAFT_81644 [Pavlovales sp. CCMP2436]|nr:hypothetical protein T492DRAFT_81644 [Pavlovales sp. CCMP2436]
MHSSTRWSLALWPAGDTCTSSAGRSAAALALQTRLTTRTYRECADFRPGYLVHAIPKQPPPAQTNTPITLSSPLLPTSTNPLITPPPTRYFSTTHPSPSSSAGVRSFRESSCAARAGRAELLRSMSRPSRWRQLQSQAHARSTQSWRCGPLPARAKELSTFKTPSLPSDTSPVGSPMDSLARALSGGPALRSDVSALFSASSSSTTSTSSPLRRST